MYARMDRTYGELLEEHFVPFASTVFGGMQNCILRDDNAQPHRAELQFGY